MSTSRVNNLSSQLVLKTVRPRVLGEHEPFQLITDFEPQDRQEAKAPRVGGAL
jgi:hypothetical protein